MSTSYYDVIVLGDDLAGLIAATLCARRGLRVLVADPPVAVGQVERYELGPYELPRRPFTFAIEPSMAIRRVVAELNFVQTIKRRLVPLRPSFQIILPDARIDVSTDAESLSRELERELPAERAAIERFIVRAAEVSKTLEPVLGQNICLPPTGFWERRELRYSGAKLPPNEEDILPGVPAGHA
ncbi:MAG: hypothetical protein V2A73_18395, partial [Pseudomonadota bacterium]